MELVVKGVNPYDGTYPFVPIDDLTRDEWRLIKNLTGYMGGTFFDGLRGGDHDTSGVMAVIGMLRVNRIAVDEVETVWARLGAANALESITVAGVEQTDEDDVGPPAIKPEENSISSGPSTENTSVISDANHDMTGTHNSGSSESDLEMLVG